MRPAVLSVALVVLNKSLVRHNRPGVVSVGEVVALAVAAVPSASRVRPAAWSMMFHSCRPRLLLAASAPAPAAVK
ncbi:hypothetical protein D9M70_511660 [compost metagenome]